MLAGALTLYLLIAMPGMDHSSDLMTSGEIPRSAGPQPLSPEVFAERMARSDAFLVNVHTPPDVRIAGTAAAIAYNAVARDDRLPRDRATPILLYCRTGQMSETAGRALRAAGYDDVSHLAGGTDAWQRAGLPLDAG